MSSVLYPIYQSWSSQKKNPFRHFIQREFIKKVVRCERKKNQIGNSEVIQRPETALRHFCPTWAGKTVGWSLFPESREHLIRIILVRVRPWWGAGKGIGTTEGDSSGVLSQRGRSILLLLMTREKKISGFLPSPLGYYTSSSLGQKFAGASCQRSLKNGTF